MPIRSAASKERIVDALLQTSRQVHRLIIRLRFQGREGDVAAAERRARRLSRHLDALLGAAVDDWLGSAAGVEAEIRRVNRRLGRTLGELRRRREVADHLTKALGLIDEAVRIAARLLA